MGISGSISLTALLNGTTLNGHAAVINGPLVQRYNKTTSTYIPNFATMSDNAKPFVYAHINRTDTGAIMVPTAVTFAYNGVALSFDANGACTTTGYTTIFKKIVKSVTIGSNTYQMPSLVIIGNLYSSSNTDNDIITINGTCEIAGKSLSFAEISQLVTIGETEGNQYDLYMSASGDTYLNDTNNSVVLTAHANLNGAQITDLSGYSIKWYKITTGGDVLLGSGQTVTIGVGDVDSQMNIRCDILTSNAVVASAYGTVYDASDPLEMQFAVTGITGSQIREGETAVITPHVVKRSSGEIYKENNAEVYTSFNFKTTNNAGSNYILSNETAASFMGSSASISFADTQAAGGAISLYVSAS